MNIVYSTQAVVEYDGSHYYSNAVEATYRRYCNDGDRIRIICYCKKVIVPTQNKIDDERISFVFVNKVNNINAILRGDVSQNKIIVRNIVEKSDFCFAHLPSSHGRQVVEAAKEMGIPCMNVIVGCPWDSYWNYGWRGMLIAPFAYLSLRRIQKNALYSIYVTKDFLQKRYPTTGKSIGCSNVSIQTGIGDVLEKRYERINNHETSGNLKIGTAAAIDVPFKGQEYVIMALAKLKKRGIIYEYHLIGKGNKNRLEHIAKQQDVINQVFFHGAIPHHEVLDFFDNIDIYIQPSKQEGLPRALIEAMSRGCLCFGSKIAGIPELLDDDYLFPKGDAHKIAMQLESISSDSLREQAKRNFDIAKSYDYQILDQRRAQFISEFYNLCRPE